MNRRNLLLPIEMARSGLPKTASVHAFRLLTQVPRTVRSSSPLIPGPEPLETGAEVRDPLQIMHSGDPTTF